MKIIISILIILFLAISQNTNTEYLQKLDSTQKEQSGIIIKRIFNELKTINDYKIPLKFEESTYQDIYNQPINVLTIGDIGNGKSTLSSWIMYKYLSKYTTLKFNPQYHKFKAGKSAKSITKEITEKSTAGITIIDTPGTNDSDEDKNLGYTFQNYITYLKNNQIIQYKGLSGIIQCVMLRTSGRIEHISIKAMTKLLLSFTYLYEDFQVENRPKINIVFTDFSRYGNTNNNNNDLGNLPCDHSSCYENENRLGFEDLVSRYKNQLVSQIRKEYPSLNQQFIQKRVDQLFKHDNFYAFKDGLNDKMMQEQEESEVERLIQDNKDNKKWKDSNLNNLENSPQFENVRSEDPQEFIVFVNGLISFYEEQLQKRYENFKIATQQEASDTFQDLILQIQQVKKEFNDISTNHSHVLRKVHPVLKEHLHSQIQKFSFLTQEVYFQEISKFHSQTAEKLKEEKKQVEKQLQQQQEEIRKLGKLNQQLLDKFSDKDKSDIIIVDGEIEINQLKVGQNQLVKDNGKLKEEIKKQKQQQTQQLEKKTDSQTQKDSYDSPSQSYEAPTLYTYSSTTYYGNNKYEEYYTTNEMNYQYKMRNRHKNYNNYNSRRYNNYNNNYNYNYNSRRYNNYNNRGYYNRGGRYY